MSLRKLIRSGLMLFALTLMMSCAKDVVQHENISTNIDNAKLQKIERFISITWQTPAEKILFNETTREFQFGENAELRMNEADMERLYDISNEYKAKYENN